MCIIIAIFWKFYSGTVHPNFSLLNMYESTLLFTLLICSLVIKNPKTTGGQLLKGANCKTLQDMQPLWQLLHFFLVQSSHYAQWSYKKNSSWWAPPMQWSTTWKKLHHSLMDDFWISITNQTLDFKTFKIWKSEKLFMLSQTILYISQN